MKFNCTNRNDNQSNPLVYRDLLITAPGRMFLRASWFPVLLQVLTLAAGCCLAYAGWNIGRDSTNAELLVLRKTNLTTLMVWGLWWPGMVMIAVAFGRAWCTVCPMELIHRIGHVLGGRLGLSRRGLGSWLRDGWFVVLGYAVMQLIVAGMNIHRIPYLTVYLLLVLTGMAFITGVIYKHPRAFCHSFCPAKALLSVYGRFTPVQLDMRDQAVCVNCATRECVSPALRHRFDKRSCPSRIVPYKRNPADGCVLCFQCAKVCPYDNMGFGLTRSEAGSRELLLLRPYETAFVLMAAGLVFNKVTEEVKSLVPYTKGLPTWLNGFAPDVNFGWFEALWFLLLLPLALWGVVVAISYIIGYRGGFGRLLMAAATGAAPVVAFGHVAKGLAKMSTWAGYLPGSLKEPRGVDHLLQYLEHSGMPGALIGLPALGWILLPFLCIAMWWVRRILKNAPEDALPAVHAGLYTMAFVLFLSLLAWPLL